MKSIKDALAHRFGDFDHAVDPRIAEQPFLQGLASRGVCRRFREEAVPTTLIETLAALALSAPTKSDMQQRDIMIVDDPAIRGRIDTLLAEQDWIPQAPHFIVFLGNNRRQRQIHDWTGIPFANDHLDAFFNASVVRAGGRGGGAGLLPGQRHSKPCRGGERVARPAGPCVSGCRARVRLAVGAVAYQRAAPAFGNRPPQSVYRRHARSCRGLRPPAQRHLPLPQSA
jgi:nitroreductase